MTLVCAGGDSHRGAGTGSLPLPLGCGTLVHTLEKGKEAGGWNMMLTPSSLLEGAMGMPPPKPLHPVAELPWKQLRPSDTHVALLCSVPHPARVRRSFWEMSWSFG